MSGNFSNFLIVLHHHFDIIAMEALTPVALQSVSILQASLSRQALLNTQPCLQQLCATMHFLGIISIDATFAKQK